jgi:hypothetical protein
VTAAELVEAVVQEAPPGKARAAGARAEAEHRGAAERTCARARATGGRCEKVWDETKYHISIRASWDSSIRKLRSRA